MSLRHVVLVNSRPRGLQYGMVRDFEDEIVRRTGASLVETPSRALPGFISRRVAHGTRYSAVRQWVPRGQFELAADVLWVPLMGPEDFELDLFAGWDRRVGVKILYFFDTFEAQLPAIRRVLAATSWDFVSTAFTDAKPFLEARTQRPWHIIPQGVRLERFRPAPTEERVIDFSAYGRRLQPVHEAVRRFCAASKKYYDYTTSAQVQAPLDAREHYAQYAGIYRTACSPSAGRWRRRARAGPRASVPSPAAGSRPRRAARS